MYTPTLIKCFKLNNFFVVVFHFALAFQRDNYDNHYECQTPQKLNGKWFWIKNKRFCGIFLTIAYIYRSRTRARHTGRYISRQNYPALLFFFPRGARPKHFIYNLHSFKEINVVWLKKKITLIIIIIIHPYANFYFPIFRVSCVDLVAFPSSSKMAAFNDK